MVAVKQAQTNGHTNGHLNGNGKVHIEPPSPPPMPKAPQPPNNIEAEEALIGALLLDEDMLLDVSFLESNDFYIGKHGWIYEAIRDVSEGGNRPDLISVAAELERLGRLDKVGGPPFLSDLSMLTPFSLSAPAYAQIIYRESVRRTLIQRAATITKETYTSNEADPETLIGQALQSIADIDQGRTGSAGPQPIRKAAGKFLSKAESERAGLPTGIKAIDNYLKGMQRGKLYLLAGRPGMGKSALALTIARTLAKNCQKRVLIFSLEMPSEDVFCRLVSQETAIPYDEIYGSGLSGEQWTKVYTATEAVEKLSIHIDDQPLLKSSVLKSRAFRQMARGGVDLIIVDHFGLTRSDSRRAKVYEESSAISDEALALAKNLNVPVLGLLQLNREVENAKNKKPTLSNLRDSGKWEENADGVMFIYRDGYYNKDTEHPNLAEIILAKNRGGNTGTANVFWKPETMDFHDLQMGGAE